MSLYFRRKVAPLKIRPEAIISSNQSSKHLRSINNLRDNQESFNNVDPLNTDRANNIQIGRKDLTTMLREMKQEILEETMNKKDNFINNIIKKQDLMDDGKMAFTKDEIRQLLRDYKQKIKSDIEYDKEQRMNTENAYYQNIYNLNQQYNSFQSLLWYYYIYNPEAYRQLIDEYNHRLHNQLLGSLGLSEQFSNVNKEKPNENPAKFLISPKNINNNRQNSARNQNKPNMRKSLYNGNTPDHYEETNTPINHKRIISLDNGNSGKMLYYAGADSNSTLQNAGKVSILPKDNLAKLRTKSIISSKEKRDPLSLTIEENTNEIIVKRNSKYKPILGLDLLGNSAKSLEIPKKVIFPQKTIPSFAANNENKVVGSMNSKSSSEYYNIYGIQDSIKQSSVFSKSPINQEVHHMNPLKLTELRSSSIEEREIIIDRYNIKIRKKEYNALKSEGIMNEGLIDFFLKYLQEKQAFLSQKKLSNNQMKILYFPLNFYEILTKKTLTIDQLNEIFISKGNSIEKFDKILIPVTKDSIDLSYNFIMAEIGPRIARYYEIMDEVLNENSEILGNVKRFLRDLSGKTMEEKNKKYHKIIDEAINEKNNEIFGNIKRFLKDVSGKHKEWQIHMGKIGKILEKKTAGLYFCKSVYCISQGIEKLNNKEKETLDFKQKLINLVIKMARVLDEKGEIDDFRVFDL